MIKTSIGSSLKSRLLPIPERWCLHSYYSLCPYAPDGSGRLLVAGANLATGTGEIYILSGEGDILKRFASHPVTPSFWHTGFWQSWSPDARYIYYQGGSEMNPMVVRHELATGDEVSIPGDMEGIPPSGEPGFCCDHSLLYAAGYGDSQGRYRPEKAIVPFQARDRHGISLVDFESGHSTLKLTTAQILETHPDQKRLLEEDRKCVQQIGEGLTLMTYCVRWNRQGTRCLFYFGNHCVDKRRQEPKLAYIFTADRDLGNIQLALDLSFRRRGVHWAWQPDGERLIGYGPRDDDPSHSCLAEVRYDGTGYRKLVDHASGGHPSVSPANDDLIVTDEHTDIGGAVRFFSRSSGQEVGRVDLPKFIGDREPPGRNPERVCHHPVFSHDGSRVLCNSLPGQNAQLVEIESPSYF